MTDLVVELARSQSASRKRPEAVAGLKLHQDARLWGWVGLTPAVVDQFDRYHPTVDSALLGGADCQHPQFLNIGFWDDSGSLKSLKTQIDGVDWFEVTDPDDLGNGYYPVSITGVNLADFRNTRVNVIATDDEGNTQRYEKSVPELVTECLASGGSLP